MSRETSAPDAPHAEPTSADAPAVASDDRAASPVDSGTDFVSVVIPVTSVEIDLDELIDGYSRPLQAHGYEFELIFVLDGVHGAFVNELQARRSGDRSIEIVRLQGDGLGESIALSAGVARARGTLIINAPQYLQSEPEDLIKVIQAMESGADLVATWRHPRVDPWLNRMQSRVFNWCLRRVMGIQFHDLNSGLRGLRRQVVEEVNVYGEMYRFLPVLAERQGFRVVEVKVRHREEKGRQGFYGIGVYLRRLLDILAITFLTRFTQKPLRFFGMLGFASIVVGLVLCIDPLWGKLVDGYSIGDRPIFVLGVIVVAFGIQLIGFGLVGEIIIFTQARNLRDYKIEETLEGGVLYDDVPDVVSAESPSTAAIRIRELLPGEDARWDSYVHRHERGTFFHLSGWRKVVDETFDHEAHYLVAEQGRRWVGVLPLFFVRSPFLGKQLISVPYGVYGGVLADSDEIFDALVDAAVRQGRALKASYVEFRHLEPRPGDRELSELYVTFRKQLPATVDEVMPSIPKKARAEVRRARDRFGMTCRETDDLDVFFRLFAQDKLRLGSPSLPLRWFTNLRDEFGKQVVVHVVEDPNGEPRAAVMSFVFRDTLYAYYSGSSDARGTGVNDFVYCKIMEWCVERGFRVYDFGRSRRDTGAAKFKKNMGFEAEPLHYEYVLLADDARLPNFHPSNPKLNTPRRVWSKLPMFVANRLGGKLSRYLP